jgi:hypothetical protein
MHCPEEIFNSVLEIIYFAALRIRAAGAHKDSAICEIEATHIHNLPSLIKDYKVGKLLYYMDIEVPLFVGRSRGVNINCYEPLWQNLRSFVEENHLRPTDGPAKI